MSGPLFAGRPLSVRWALRVVAFVVLAAGPAWLLAHHLVVGTIIESWPWMLWGESYLRLAEMGMDVGRHLLWVALLVVGWAVTGRLFLARDERGGPVRRWTGGLLLTLAGAGLVVPLLINSVRLVRTWPPRTAAVVDANCGHCHSSFRPRHYIRGEDAWRRTVDRMREVNGAPVSDEDAERVIAWLADYRGFSDAWMFKAKCERCHAKHLIDDVPRSATEWEQIVERVAWLSPFAFRADQRAQIVRYLASELAVEAPEGSAEREAQVEREELAASCNPCHAIALVREEGALDNAVPMLERMHDKAPELVPRDRIEPLAETLRALPTDDEFWWTAFPHDILLEEAR